MQLTSFAILLTLSTTSLAAPVKRGIMPSSTKSTIHANAPVPNFPHGVPELPGSPSGSDGGLATIPKDSAPLISDLVEGGAESAVGLVPSLVGRDAGALPGVGALGGLGGLGGLTSLTSVVTPVVGQVIQGSPIGTVGHLLRRGILPADSSNLPGAAGSLPILGRLPLPLARKSLVPAIPTSGAADLESVPNDALPLVGDVLQSTPLGSLTLVGKRDDVPLGPLGSTPVEPIGPFEPIDPSNPVDPIESPINDPNAPPSLPVDPTPPLPATSTPDSSELTGSAVPLAGDVLKSVPLSAVGNVEGLGNVVRRSTLPSLPTDSIVPASPLSPDAVTSAAHQVLETTPLAGTGNLLPADASTDAAPSSSRPETMTSTDNNQSGLHGTLPDSISPAIKSVDQSSSLNLVSH
jgi:hypothetical protein